MAVRRRSPAQVPWWKGVLLRLIRLNDSPERVAGGFAIGVFVGVAPTFGFGLLVTGFLAVFLRCNVAAAVVGSASGAPPLIFLFWALSAWVGSFFFGLDFARLYAMFKSGAALRAGGEVFSAYLVGNVFVTAVATALGYWVVLAIMRRAAARKAASSPPRSRSRASRSRRS